MSTRVRVKSLGYQQITNLSAAVGLTIPSGTVFCLCIPESQSVRWRDDGTNPTASAGQPLAVGQELEYDSNTMAALKFIEQAASAKLNVYYFGAP